MYISSVALTRVFVCDPANVSLQVICGSNGSLGGGGQRVHTKALDGDFRKYAGNRVRLVTTAAVARTIPITLRTLTKQQAIQIERWAGTTLLFRDSYGTRLFGSYIQPQRLHIPRTSHGTLIDIAIQLQNVTYSDAV